MATYIQKPFAINGDITEIPTDTTLNGAVSFQQGYTQYYELDPATDPLAQRIERSKMNYLFNTITANTKEWQEQTFPAWISDSGNGTPFGYQIGAIVKYTDGKFYQSTVDNNTEPPTNKTNWQEFKPLITTPANVILATLNTAIGVVALGTQFYCSENKNTYILIKNTNVTAETTLQELINSNSVQNNTPLGVGQTWRNVSSQRYANVTYTNNTDRVIIVQIDYWFVTDGIYGFYIDNVYFGGIYNSNAGAVGTSMSFVVPSGSTYKLEINNPKVWLELR
ncbi:Uncharacterised protein [Campylobacter hyointestinalis subsp. hyointestinalis]|uniref:Uncharacterized protein n=1 Tax=Campylobacter hyointestinalis subsp. hyointestinalis TaxID=91352 RepID=A0A0S4R3R1_CAMHY|nr:hypothetical protein [Campylobacter hyointestinalis]CUU68183.1 Uncharacterised protein [Campylobacter hyointestinalis subsp. hyointestinalis]